ncbi:hypothetical protein POM88_033452 [Heracleum sosnowskyi]|uniref:SET domain-containing protein n=1 Tax=Heracleum sosnowskyi TaxID=360622 RepID=A0AAD8I170_9APIA|nr:hypothetical protein POM88_033452 [Heracleum sosnowskyi]
MTEASLVPPVTRKNEVLDHYVIVADQEEVERKMQVSLPDEYKEKLDVQKSGADESDMENPEVKDYKPRKQLGDEVLEQEVYGIDPYTHNLLLDSMPEELDWPLSDKLVFIEDVFLRTLNEQARTFIGTEQAPMNCPDDNYVAYRKGLGVVCNKEGGFDKDDFVVGFMGEVYPAWKWFEKQDGIRSLHNHSKDPVPEFYHIYLERPKGDADGYDLVVIDAMHKANYASCICHSCRPNCEENGNSILRKSQKKSVRLIGVPFGWCRRASIQDFILMQGHDQGCSYVWAKAGCLIQTSGLPFRGAEDTRLTGWQMGGIFSYGNVLSAETFSFQLRDAQHPSRGEHVVLSAVQLDGRLKALYPSKSMVYAIHVSICEVLASLLSRNRLRTQGSAGVRRNSPSALQGSAGCVLSLASKNRGGHDENRESLLLHQLDTFHTPDTTERKLQYEDNFYEEDEAVPLSRVKAEHQYEIVLQLLQARTGTSMKILEHFIGNGASLSQFKDPWCTRDQAVLIVLDACTILRFFSTFRMICDCKENEGALLAQLS